MKKLLVLSLFFSLSNMYSALAIGQYGEGDTLFVWAKSGLVLRAAADFKAEKIITLPYGTAVKTLSHKYRDEDISEIEVTVVKPYSFEGKNYPGYKIPGQWVKVTVQGKTGYLFDSYLSKYPPMLEKSESGSREYWDDYLSRVFGQAGTSTDTSRRGHVPEYDIVFYKNGASRQSRSVGDGLSSHTYMLPELSLEEGFLLANYFYDLEKNSNRPAKADDEEDAPYRMLQSTSNLLDFESDSSFQGSVKIGYVNGVVVITTFFSC